ncbi:MAG: hypothetical protein M0000_01535 [Actinomycetota bacterium]|nr:hypothetical protein [Actinomycetota bacterium]MDA8209449.1 hypothetical protein [Actinomycetota bacterium]
MPPTRFLTTLVACALGTTLVMTPTPAGASGNPATASGGDGRYTITLYTLASATAPGNPGSAKVLITPDGRRIYPVMFPTITTNSQLFANTPCIAVFFEYYSNVKQASAVNFSPQLLYLLSRRYPLCRYRPVKVTTSPTPPSDSQELIRSSITRVLPVPSPSMDPGYGVAGLASFLSTQARLEDALQAQLPGGGVHALAQGTLTVDWGDGSPPAGPTTATGGPWPLGDLRHNYSPGCYEVSVTVNWLVRYQAAGRSGTLSGIKTSGVIPRYCVYQVASVMLR